MKSFLDAKEPSEMDKKEREAQAWKEYLKMQIQEKKDRLAREKQFEQEQDARAAARFARELEMEERAARGESKEKELEAFTPKPEINIETKLPSMTKNQKVPKAPQTTVSKLPVLRGLPRHLDPIDSNRLQPLIERIKELSEAVIIHPSPPPQSLTRSSTTKMLNGRHCPQPPSHQQPNGAPPSSNRSLRYGQKLAKKITQKFPIRGDLNTPPKNGIRVWPAGSKAYSQYPPDPLPHIPHHSLRNVPEEEKEEATKTTTDPRVKRFVRQDPVTHRSQVPQPPPKPVKGLTPIPPPMQEDEEEMYDDSKEEESPSSEKPMATKPTTTGQCPPSPLIHGRNKAGASVGSSAESIERREAVEKLEAVWKDFVKSKTEEYGIAPSG